MTDTKTDKSENDLIHELNVQSDVDPDYYFGIDIRPPAKTLEEAMKIAEQENSGPHGYVVGYSTGGGIHDLKSTYHGTDNKYDYKV